MKSNNAFVIIATVGCIGISTSCMTVKDTSGIKQYLKDQGRAEMLALDIKSKNPENSKAYQKAEKLFNRAAGEGNGWTRGVVLDAKLKQKVDVSISDYKTDSVGKAIDEFLAQESGNGAKFDPVTAGLIATFVVSVIDKLEEQNNKRTERAVETIQGEFARSQWTTFKLTTQSWMKAKYGAANKNTR